MVAESKQDDVEKTIKEIKAEQREVVAKKRTATEVFLLCIKIIFFPITLLYMLCKRIFRKINMPITAKMTILYTIMFACVLAGFTVFFITSIKSQLPESSGSRSYINSVILTTCILDVTFTALFASLGAVSSQFMLKPIRSMTKKIDEITSENLGARLNQMDSQDELMELTNRINQMLDNLEGSFNRQQNFIADASHELKTPIAVIQGYANLIKRWGFERPEILAEGLDAIARESENMKKIVEKLLLLAKLGTMSMNITHFNLVEVVSEMVASYKLIAKNHNIVFVGSGNIEVEADKNLLLESVRTLVDNAVKYTPVGGNITVYCTSQANGAEISVVDTGLGINDEDLPHIFERFYRCDKARGRENGSSGLGLTIAKSIVESMKGEIYVTSKTGEGSTFTIKIFTQKMDILQA